MMTTGKRKEYPCFIYIVILAITIGTFFYLFKSRETAEIIKYTLYNSIPGVFIFFAAYITNWPNTDPKYFNKLNFTVVLLSPILIIFVGLSYYAIGVCIKDLYLWLYSPALTKPFSILLIILITFFIGLFLFFIRLNYRILYGLSEIIIGLWIAVQKVLSEIIESSFSIEFYLAMLTAAIYLVVRGLDNIQQGLTKNQ